MASCREGLYLDCIVYQSSFTYLKQLGGIYRNPRGFRRHVVIENVQQKKNLLLDIFALILTSTLP